MDSLTGWLIDFVSSSNNPAGLAVLFASALIEYVLPPFPGDTITLFGAVLITAYGWSFAAVFGVVMAGSVAGSMIDYSLGKYLGIRRLARHQSQTERHRTIDRLIARFERYGPAYLIVNRFLPGVRALFFVAAGMARMRPGAVLLYSTISAALWNLGIIALGSLLGANFETLERWMRRYTLVTWLLIGVVAVVWVLVSVWRRHRSRQRRGDDGAGADGGPGDDAT